MGSFFRDGGTKHRGLCFGCGWYIRIHNYCIIFINIHKHILVIYDDDITDAFVNTTIKLFKSYSKLQNIFVALEKRFVFTKDSFMDGNEGVAPMYEYYLKVSNNYLSTFNLDHQQKFTLHMEAIPTKFPQYFEYERCKELVLFKIFKKTKNE